jgi:hypothetical protein
MTLLLGIYTLEGDTLKLCFLRTAKAAQPQRPKGFNRRDPREQVMVLKRDKRPGGGDK